MFIPTDRPLETSRRQKVTVFLLVLAAHLAILWWFALMRFSGPLPSVQIFEVSLFPPGGGGGRPAVSAEATSAAAKPAAILPLHVPKTPEPWVDKPPAPSPAPPGELLVPAATLPVAGTGTEASRSEAKAQAGSGGAGGGNGGGVGTGSGTGVGSGSGPGRGIGAPRFIRGPAGAIMSENVSGAELARVSSHHAVFRCMIGPDGRASRCRLLNETPPGEGVASAALEKTREFRWTPAPRSGGRVRQDYPKVIGIAFPGPSVTEPGVDGT